MVNSVHNHFPTPSTPQLGGI